MKLTRIELNGKEYFLMHTEVHPVPYYHVYSAWEKTELGGNHSTITSGPNGGWIGRVGTRRWESELPAMSDERSEAYNRQHKSQCDEAYEAIAAVYPAEAAAGERRHGEITIY